MKHSCFFTIKPQRRMVIFRKAPTSCAKKSRCKFLLHIWYAFLFMMTPQGTMAWNNGQCLTPPMGWNSWNRFGCNVSESLIKETADAMVTSGMRDAGYRYVVIDDCWQVRRDAQGNIVADPQRFPSGIDSLSRYIRSKGLELGLYTDAGTGTCEGRPGSRGYEDRDMAQYAAWKVGYTKVDWCNTGGQDPTQSYMKFREAIRKTGYPIVFSICSWSYFAGADTIGHLWRTTDDIDCEFGSAMDILDKQVGMEKYAGPGHWNDPDMLEVSDECLVVNENRAHFSMWCMLAAPLISGNDPRNMSANTRAILTNAEVIAIDQDSLGAQGRRIKTAANGNLQTWAKRLKNGDIALCFLNRWQSPADMSITWAELAAGLGISISSTKTFQIRDLWKHQNLTATTGSFTARAVPTSDVVMVRLSDSPTKVSQSAFHKAKSGLIMRQANRSLFVEFRQPVDAVITMVDSKGALVRSTRCSGARLRIDTNDIRAGAHIVKIQVGNTAYAQKITFR